MSVPSFPRSSVWSIERLVVLLSPIFTGLAAGVVGSIAVHFPGHPKLNAADVRDLMITGATAAVILVFKWLHGRQKPEITQLSSPAALSAAVDAALGWLERNNGRLIGPPGPAGTKGPTPEQVRAIVREEWAGLLSQTQTPASNSPALRQ